MHSNSIIIPFANHVHISHTHAIDQQRSELQEREKNMKNMKNENTTIYKHQQQYKTSPARFAFSFRSQPIQFTKRTKSIAAAKAAARCQLKIVQIQWCFNLYADYVNLIFGWFAVAFVHCLQVAGCSSCLNLGRKRFMRFSNKPFDFVFFHWLFSSFIFFFGFLTLKL